jgi:hypothetical protein
VTSAPADAGSYGGLGAITIYVAAMTFDSLTFVRRLKAAGFSEAQAEALADANREPVTRELATKDDLTAAEQSLKHDLTALRNDLTGIDQGLTHDRLLGAIKHQTLQLTGRMGVMIGAGGAVPGAILRLH